MDASGRRLLNESPNNFATVDTRKFVKMSMMLSIEVLTNNLDRFIVLIVIVSTVLVHIIFRPLLASRHQWNSRID